MRERPSVKANPVNLTVYILGTDRKIERTITRKNAMHSFDAITVAKETIDDITAPWYRISVVLDEVYSKPVWVFGGYLKEISEEDYEKNASRYSRNYYDTLLYLKILDRNR
jgi:hypothetical protein